MYFFYKKIYKHYNIKKTEVRITPYSLLLLALVCVLGCEKEETVAKTPTTNFTSVADGLKVTFTNTSTEATTYSWDFGDNTKSTDKNPVHTYTTANTYKVTLTATNSAGSTSKETNVTVTASVTNVGVTAVALGADFNLDTGDSQKISPTITPTTATDKTLTWTSLNTDIATVAADGTVTAKQMAGTARIVAVSNDNDAARDTVKVTVVPPSVAIDQEDFELLVNTGTTVTATVLPANAVQTVTWTSLDPTIATVATDNADVTTVTASAMNTGRARIVATSAGTSPLKDTVIVTVVSPAASIAIGGVPATFSFSQGATRTLTATVMPATASQRVIWSSSDRARATVATDPATGVTTLTAGSTRGSVTITATSATNSMVTGSVTATATAPITAIDIINTELRLFPRRVRDLTVNLTPRDSNKEDIIWTSSNEDVAVVVITDGNITVAVKANAMVGDTTTITGTLPNDPSISDSVQLTIIIGASGG